MDWIIKGSVLKFSDNIDTDQIYPGRYLELTDPKDIARHAMEGVDPFFLKRMKESTILIAGKNFGCGSSREHAVITLLHAGVKAVIAESFARIFFRNAINLGLPVLICPGISQGVEDGSLVEMNLTRGVMSVVESGSEIKMQKIPSNVAEILNKGGLIPYIRASIK
ncbi:MAG: 3-isopropylmalate dehydratase small subunit [Desulfitobacteriaceae bacterium]|nr:3-isopropylmalate dehydratase small subunit [Desulfitobacteriaceae bacterium]